MQRFLPLPRFVVFSIMGALTCACDALLFYSFWKGLALSAEAARIVVLPLSLTLSWWLNRSFTFKSNPQSLFKEWTGFCAINSLGAIVNALVFVGLLFMMPDLPVAIAFVAGVLAGLFFNYTGSRQFVFEKS